MKILIAPNAFKGTMTAEEAAKIIRDSISAIYTEYEFILCPIADGGDGTSFLLAKALDLPLTHLMALDALGRPTEGYFAMNRDTALMDVSTVSGIHLLSKEERDPLVTGTYGTGELVAAAIDQGATRIELGLGGTASIDMGVGVLRGLGFIFLDEYGREIPMFSPSFLSKIRHIQRPVKKMDIAFTLLCDVQNTFFGENGAVPVFGPQKGLKEDGFQEFLTAAERFIQLLKTKTGKDLEDRPSFGAAGGIAIGLNAFFPVQMVNGSDLFFEKVQMERQVRWADLVITGEGKYDDQSAEGKGSFKLMQMANKHKKKIHLITSGDDAGQGFDGVIRLPPLGPKKESEEAKHILYQTVGDFFKK
jgi:glycerate 2-kinase